MTEIPFIDLQAQQAIIGDQIKEAISNVLVHGQYILGPEVRSLEKELADFCNAQHCITCANGTDALSLALMAENISSSDTVFLPAFTFVATAEAPSLLGANLYFVDVDLQTFNMCSESLEDSIHDAKSRGLNPKAIISVDLFGLPCDYKAIRKIADKEELLFIADAAQSFGAIYEGNVVGTLADYTTTSFFPAKPLGCYGDGGAVFTEKAKNASLLQSLRFHGKGEYKYDNIRVGLNSRLDTIQAAILLEKLRIFQDELNQRELIAQKYSSVLKRHFSTPFIPKETSSTWAQYTLTVSNREKIQEQCNKNNIPTQVYYPIPLHRQKAYRDSYIAPGGLQNSETLSQSVLSLPMHPYLDEESQNKIISTLLTL
ncbi:DegT/DnrJ/EryC1/StrS aminotransferase family protein [Terasakiella sp. SH-1]|uniref:DegT/DnrJ/EryC1/StrS family aminotransferase n=1 Tax=Terasakiella sp. SH-1 TaxID=2560057 RepID=UPI00197E8677|nr:DegT/DnrJ/EryC1/StrS aminotransferase family protein [Terasakiella sp. SH-1]